MYNRSVLQTRVKLTSHQKNSNWKQALWLALVPLRLITHFCQWRSQRSSWGCGGTHAFPLRSTSVCYRHSAERLWIVSQWSLTWSGEGTATHFWCCTGPLYTPSWNTVELCMAKHQVPIYDNRIALVGLDLFNDDTRPSGHISRPTQVNVSQSCFHSLNYYSSPIILSSTGG